MLYYFAAFAAILATAMGSPVSFADPPSHAIKWPSKMPKFGFTMNGLEQMAAAQKANRKLAVDDDESNKNSDGASSKSSDDCDRARVDRDAVMEASFGTDATCAICASAAGAPSPCGGIVNFCGSGGAGYFCPETCDTVDAPTTHYTDANYCVNNNEAVELLFAAYGVTTCEGLVAGTFPHYLDYNQCRSESVHKYLCPESCESLFGEALEDCPGEDNPAFTDAQAGAGCAAWANFCSQQQAGQTGFNAYIWDCADYAPGGFLAQFNYATASLLDPPVTQCEAGGWIADSANYYAKSTMDEIRANCPVSCGTCHDAPTCHTPPGSCPSSSSSDSLSSSSSDAGEEVSEADSTNEGDTPP